MGKKKDKSKKGKGAEKTALKTEKNIEKKMKKVLKASGEKNVEALIAEYQEQGKKQLQLVEEKVEEPSPRSNGTLIAHPHRDELVLFGGEFFNGRKTTMYNDLFVYSIKHNSWKLIKIPGAPPPRSSHQAVCVKQGGGQMWLFGGEFASPTQSQFYHYKDLWVLYFSSNKWEKISVAGGPSARSGHRMVVAKKQIIVFGGFHDSHKGDYTYFNDVHVFDLDTYTWSNVAVGGTAPSPRSGCCMTLTQDEKSVIVYSGYSKKALKKDVDKGTIHEDLFTLSKSDSGQWVWSERKQSGSKPSPRCSCAVIATPGNRALFFGGVVDDENDDDINSSKFFDSLYSLELDSGRWHQVTLREKKSQGEKKRRRRKKRDCMDVEMASGDSDDATGSGDELEDTVAGLAVSSGGSGVGRVASLTNDVTAATTSMAGGGERVSAAVWPCARMNTLLAVQAGVLYLYGGMYEDDDDKQITLQDMYALDLHKLDQWRTLIRNKADQQEWEESESSGSDSDDDDDDEDDSDDDTDDDDDKEAMDTDEPPVVRAEEKLNDYFSRNKDFWLDRAEQVAVRDGVSVSMKQLKKSAFALATEHFEHRSSKR